MDDRKLKEAAKAAAAASKNAFDVDETTFSDEDSLLAQARNGIVWSEILQPPVSVR
jgi:hypothetical protein